MIDIKKKSKVTIHWNVSPYDYSKERENSLISKVSKKYSLPKDRIKIVPEFIMINADGDKVSLSNDIIENIQDPKFQVKLFEKYIKLNNITDCDFELIKKIDASINGRIDYQVYDKYRKYSVKWVRWSNFLSYGADNYFDFRGVKGLALVSSNPANQGGKTTFAIDLFHFLLFGNVSKVKTQDKIFNKHIPSATNVIVEGCICIDGIDYIIKRKLSRPSLDKRTLKSKTVQKVEYYKKVGDDVEALDEYTDNMQEENTSKTNKAIKDAIGRESDFDLIMSVTDRTLDDLVDKKEAERGRLLSRWIGLLPLEQKDALARETFNSEIKGRLISNQYNEETLLQEKTAFKLNIEKLQGDNKKSYAELENVEKDIASLEKNKESLLQSKHQIDDSLLKVDISTLTRSIEKSIEDGKSKKAEIDAIDAEIKEIGDISFSVEEYDEIQEKLNSVSNELAVTLERYKTIQDSIRSLKSSEYCPTCGKKLDGVDNHKKINELTLELENLVAKGKEKRKESAKYDGMVKNLKTARDLYTRKSQLSIKKSALEVNVERLRNEYKENMYLKREYEKNSAAIDKNNAIDLQVRNNDIYIKDKKQCKDNLLSSIARNEMEIKYDTEQMDVRDKLIDKIKQEMSYVRNWKIYLEMVGKDGISKMVLRDVLPLINSRLRELLSDVCDFDVEVGINDKNDVNFYLIKDGVYSDLASGSGFELTASALALRAVLAEMSTMPKGSILTMDEIWGRTAKSNYDNMKLLLEKIAKDYDLILLISHNDEIKDWCSSNFVITKENNISKIALENK